MRRLGQTNARTAVCSPLQPATMSATSPQQPRRIAYLVNLYPKTSHAWMRREIAAMAAAGVALARFSPRRLDEPPARCWPGPR